MLVPTARERGVAVVVRVGGDSFILHPWWQALRGEDLSRRRCFRAGRARARACVWGTEKAGVSATRCRSCKRMHRGETPNVRSGHSELEVTHAGMSAT